MTFKDLGIDLNNFSKEEEIEKFKDMEPLGWKVIIRLYIQPEKIGNIFISGTDRENEQYSTCVGLVVKMSEDAYKDPRYNKPWCKIGDWVVFARHGGYKIKYKEMPVFVLNEDAIDLIVETPLYIAR